MIDLLKPDSKDLKIEIETIEIDGLTRKDIIKTYIISLIPIIMLFAFLLLLTFLNK